MKKPALSIKIPLFFTVMLLLLCSGPLFASAASITVDNQTGDVGDEVTFTVGIVSAPNPVNGFIADVTYDPAVLEYKSGKAGNLITPGSGLFIVNGVCSACVPGQMTARIGGALPTTPIPLGATGSLATLTFTVIGCGDFTLQIPTLKDDLVGWTTGEGSFSCETAPVDDADNDGVEDAVDNCPGVANPGQEDSDNDGVGDACDLCPLDPDKTEPGLGGCGVPDTDSDGDLIVDAVDNCPNVANPGQEDADNDGVGDACDLCPSDPDKIAPGGCGCGVPDTDANGDGKPDCTGIAEDMYFAGDLSGQPGDEAAITVMVNIAPNPVSALGMDILFDPAVLQYKGVIAKGDLTQGFNYLLANEVTPGDLRIGGIIAPGEIPLDASGSLVTIYFDVIGSGNSTLRIVDQKDHIASWTFEEGLFSNQTFTIHSALKAGGAPDGGSISPEGDTSVPGGGDQTYQIQPNPGFRVAAVFVDGTDVGPVSSYTFENVSANHDIQALFAYENLDWIVGRYTGSFTSSAGRSPWTALVSPDGTLVVSVTDAPVFGTATFFGEVDEFGKISLQLVSSTINTTAHGQLYPDGSFALSAKWPEIFFSVFFLNVEGKLKPTGAVSGSYAVLLALFDNNVDEQGTFTGARRAYVAPVARFTGTPRTGCAPLPVVFNDTSAGGIVSWLWSFGDGASSLTRNPTHVYTASGRYTVSLTVTDFMGATNTRTLVNYVYAVETIANFTAKPVRGMPPLAVAFTDRSKGILTGWEWDFGDGEKSTVRSPTHTYTRPGAYTISLTVTDKNGGKNTKTVVDCINVVAPVANFTATPVYGPAPLAVAFTDASKGSIVRWDWDFGDGQVSSARSPGHTYTTPGLYTVSLTVTDSCGNTGNKTLVNRIRVK
ncbi:MAG: PKD domain-containing protein [Thermodesulfobacteriota bacterium]